MNPFVFIVGCPRSGTTLLRRMVDAHPRIALLPAETHWIPKLVRDASMVTADGRVTSSFSSKLIELPRMAKLKIPLPDISALARPGMPYTTFVSKLFDRYGKLREKDLVGDKTPGYVREIPTLHRLWPDARFVHLVRDGRDVALSAVAWARSEKLKRRFHTWAAEPAMTAALWWEWQVRLGRQAAASLDRQRYVEISYEQLVRDPAAEMRKLCSFLGVDYADAMVRFHEGRTRTDTGLDAKHAWLPPTPGLRDWRSQMPPGDVARFEAAAGDLLQELGYERGVPHPSAKALRLAVECRERFVRDIGLNGPVSGRYPRARG